MHSPHSATRGAGRARRVPAALGVVIAAAIGAAILSTGAAAAGPVDYWILPPASFDPSSSAATETIVLAGGCFWGIQAVFQRINGVESAVSGYAGGSVDTASYGRVLTGATGHAEAVEIVFDPSVISTGELLRVFFSVAHDPTQLNRQYADVGAHYRSHIYTTTPQQLEVANAYIAQLDVADIYRAPIVTRVDAFISFFPAEGYHQDYLVNNGRGDPNGPNVGYLRYWDYPKMGHASQVFPEYWRATAALVADTHPEIVN
ncbi:MAG: peptide-methionine (S)-S-oxide reductase MsrA [Alphaproteobacteria bacterium]